MVIEAHGARPTEMILARGYPFGSAVLRIEQTASFTLACHLPIAPHHPSCFIIEPSQYTASRTQF